MVMMSKTFHNLSFVGYNLQSCLAIIWEKSCGYLHKYTSTGWLATIHAKLWRQTKLWLTISFVCVIRMGLPSKNLLDKTFVLVVFFLWPPFGVN